MVLKPQTTDTQPAKNKGIEITNNKIVSVAAASRVRSDPVCERGSCLGTSRVALALPVIEIGVTTIGTGRALGFKMINDDRENGAV